MNANNALAEANALNFQNYYTPSVCGVPDANSNAMNLRGVIVSGRRIIRATLPAPLQYESGLGDVTIFDAIGHGCGG
jgi:hypothetical protein